MYCRSRFVVDAPRNWFRARKRLSSVVLVLNSAAATATALYDHLPLFDLARRCTHAKINI